MAPIIGRIAVTTPILAVSLCIAAMASRANAETGTEASSTIDYDAAVREWQGLATQGDAEALFNLAQAYKFGKGVRQDVAWAEQLFGEAAAKGHVQAADNFGLMRFQRGDKAGALPYIRAAADRGDARAQYLLGISYFNGDIVEKDWARAYALVTLAAQAGLPQASSAIAQMDMHIPVEEREQANTPARHIPAPSDPAPTEQGVSPALAEVVPAEIAKPAAPAPALAKPKPVAKPAAPTGSASGRWRIQLGAFSVRANADALWSKVKHRPELSGHARINAGSGKVIRLLAGGFSSEAEAARACSRLSASGISCLVTRN